MTKPKGRVSSYNRRAPLPGVGSIWVWELDLPHACELIKVTEVFWNGEEWWVRTASWPSRYHREIPAMFGGEPVQLNDLSRFWEAVTPVRETRTPRPTLRAALDDGTQRP